MILHSIIFAMSQEKMKTDGPDGVAPGFQLYPKDLVKVNE